MTTHYINKIYLRIAVKNLFKMVKIKYSSDVKVVVNKCGNTSTQLIHCNETWPSKPSKKIQQQQDIEKHLSDLTDHFDSKLESLNNLILKELTEKINKIEKSVQTIGQLHETLIEKIGKLELIVSRMKTEQDINVQMKEIKDLKQQISLLQAKVSAIQEQKQLLISRMNDFDAMKQQHIDAMEKQPHGEIDSLKTFQNEGQKNEELVCLLSKLTTNSPKTPQEFKKIIDRIPPRSIKKRNLSKNVIVRFKFMQLKSKIFNAGLIMRFMTHKGQAV